MVVAAGNVSQLEITAVNGYSVSIELVVRLPDKIQTLSDFQFLKGFRAIPIAEYSDVEVGQMHFLDWSVFFCFHKESNLVVYLSESKIKQCLCQIKSQ